MTSSRPARHRVAIAGYVTDLVTAKPVAGVNVVIFEAPEIFIQKVRLIGLQFGTTWNAKLDRLDRTRTREDGSFYFTGLPAGVYKVMASTPGLGKRYGSADASVTVEQDTQDTFTLNWVTLSLPSTALRGTVTSNKTGVNFAEIRIQGSGERTFSDGRGEYCISGLEPGIRTVLVNAQGFLPISQSVQVAVAEESPVLDFKLLRVAG